MRARTVQKSKRDAQRTPGREQIIGGDRRGRSGRVSHDAGVHESVEVAGGKVWIGSHFYNGTLNGGRPARAPSGTGEGIKGASSCSRGRSLEPHERGGFGSHDGGLQLSLPAIATAQKGAGDSAVRTQCGAANTRTIICRTGSSGRHPARRAFSQEDGREIHGRLGADRLSTL